ncbi:MAG: hypothetical protein C0614_05850, partial [Desulfuromonas sp.]
MKNLLLPAGCQSWFRSCLLCLVLVGMIGSCPSWAFTVDTLEVHDDVTVLEVSCLYDSMVNDQVDNTPQREVAKEFIRTHGDQHDFLVVFTNFDFLMPSPSARAFFTPVRNDVDGIGIPRFDYSPAFSPTGTPLDRLQGVIDMANLNSHQLQPTDPGFEETLQILTHELMHRWGAYVGYQGHDGERSERLLG